MKIFMDIAFTVNQLKNHKGVTMLVLGRNVGQSIFIGKDITITIVGNRYGQVKVGIEAPKDVLVLREELTPYSKKKAKINRKLQIMT